MYPLQVEVGGPVNFKGENLGLVKWAVFTDKNRNTVTSAATGKDVGRVAESTLPAGLEIGHGKVYLMDEDKNKSNTKDIDFVRP